MVELESPLSVEMYRAMAVLSADSAGMLEEIEMVSPLPSPGNVVIRVHRAGVAFGDIIRASNSITKLHSFPWVPGYDLAGEVVAVGPVEPNAPARRSEFPHLAPGDRVSAWAFNGAYGQYIEVPAAMAMKIPENLSYDYACALNLNYITAWQLLFRAAGLPRLALTDGRRPVIWVQSAAGGVGTALLQLAALFGIKAYGSASAGKHDLVESLGGIPLDYRRSGFTKQILESEKDGLDAVFESRGLGSAGSSRKLLKKGGRLVLFGFLDDFARGTLTRNTAYLFSALSLFAPFQKGKPVVYGINPEKKLNWYREDLARLLELGATGKIKPVISEVLPLDQAQSAWEKLKSGQVRGKILLDPTV